MCVHRESQAQRAVKVLRKSHMDEEEKRMLFNEINILKEIANIWKLLGVGNVDTIITKDDFQHFWKRAMESLILGGTR